MLTRLSVLPDERRLLLGVDKAEIFTPRIVYDVKNILDTIVITPIGKYSLPQYGFPSEMSGNGDIILFGEHLITEEEKAMYLKTKK